MSSVFQCSVIMSSIFLKLILVLTVCNQVLADDLSHHRHRHARGHSAEYSSLDHLLNRWSNRSPSSSRSPVTTSTPTPGLYTEPENSLWDDDSAGTGTPLDKQQQQEQREDAEDDLEEKDVEEEDDFDDENEQADSFSPWNSRGGDESYSNWKWEKMGSKKSVDNMFQIYKSGVLRPGKPQTDTGSKDAAAQWEVYRHNKQMGRDTLCRVPRPKVIRVSDFYPSPNKLFVPACTILHQCGDDTGCCSGSTQRCGPKTTERVELYFYTTNIINSNSRQKTSSGLEKLAFYNHTECKCQDRLEEVMPRDSQSADYRAAVDTTSQPSCKCPSEFTVRRLANGSCTCDCFDKQRDCIKYKRGKEYFNHADRLCIEMGTCKQPACEYGVYLRTSGRCPKSRHEKFRTWNRYH